MFGEKRAMRAVHLVGRRENFVFCLRPRGECLGRLSYCRRQPLPLPLRLEQRLLLLPDTRLLAGPVLLLPLFLFRQPCLPLELFNCRPAQWPTPT